MTRPLKTVTAAGGVVAPGGGGCFHSDRQRESQSSFSHPKLGAVGKMPSGLLRQLSKFSSNKATARPTCEADIFMPHSFSTIANTLQVDTSCTYISASVNISTR